MYNTKKAKWAVFFGLSPILLIYVVMAVVPIIISFYYSFYDWNGLTDRKFIGLENYIEIFTDSNFWNSFKNNIIIILAGLLVTIPLGFCTALALNKALKGIKFYRMAFFLPVVISAAIISLVWGFVFNVEHGLINSFLEMIGLDGLTRNWLGNPNIAIYSVSVTYIWSNFGLYMVIFLAAIQTVPKEIIEAALIDGANGWVRLWKVIIPSIKETMVVAIIFSISSSFRAFDLLFVLTGGGPSKSTEIMTLYMYENTFQFMRFGYGSAISVVILVISFIVISIVQFSANTDRKKKLKH
ncbi:sugar ABC transporter permease [Bacillus sp. J14TS2]|uniref:carbohydrate ABC transporter permease n=1 Tax=Bacillus sp. J14TS2 TaxID=2807188 RepID=UPI001B12A149|nr:sugar ABC transporter permease [Bacillus sp. J14TS2]GIN71582.1 sugar ABC transporter permease [Bacillus sp. J14TS2]